MIEKEKDPVKVEMGKNVGAFKGYKNFRENILGGGNRGKQSEFLFGVYKELSKQNPDIYTMPFQIGLDKYRFPREMVTLRNVVGNTYQGPTIEKLMLKIIRAYEATLEKKWNERKDA